MRMMSIVVCCFWMCRSVESQQREKSTSLADGAYLLYFCIARDICVFDLEYKIGTDVTIGFWWRIQRFGLDHRIGSFSLGTTDAYVPLFFYDRWITSWWDIGWRRRRLLLCCFAFFGGCDRLVDWLVGGYHHHHHHHRSHHPHETFISCCTC